MTDYEHEFTPIVVNGVAVEVSRDALKVGGVRVNLTYDQALEWAVLLGGELPTCAVLDARWELAEVQNYPHPGPVATKTARHHSSQIDRDVDKYETGCWLVGNVGKHWVKPESGDEGSFPLYGWHINSRYRTWRGIKLHESYSDQTNAKVIQPYSPNAHGSTHTDYSMTGVFMRRALSDVVEIIPETPPEMTSPGDKGSHVEMWQQWLLKCGYTLPRWGVDGDHGMETEKATREYLADRGIERSERTTKPPPAEPLIEVHDTDVSSLGDDIPFKQAQSYRAGRPAGPPIWLVIHTAETLEVGTSAEALQSWAASGKIGVSWHYAVDNNSVTQSVRESDTAYACPGLNARGVHIELSGKAGQGPEGWDDDYSAAVLRNAAELCAAVIRRQKRIKAVKLTPSDLLNMQPGICGHVDGRDALRMAKKRGYRHEPWYDSRRRRMKTTTHYDPGPHFPWDDFMTAVRDRL